MVAVVLYVLVTSLSAIVARGGDQNPHLGAPRVYDIDDIDNVLRAVQQNRSLCGPVSLSAALRVLGHDVGVDELLTVLRLTDEGTSLADLVAAARRFESDARAMTWEAGARLQYVDVPAVLVLGEKHAVALIGCSHDGRRCLIVDGTKREISEQEVRAVERNWTGTAIVFRPRRRKREIWLLFGVLSGTVGVFVLVAGMETKFKS